MISVMDLTTWKSFEILSSKTGLDWLNIRCASEKADGTLARLREETVFAKMPPDTAFVIFGSLARGEETERSDIDWTLLIDGQADANHLQFAHSISACLHKMELAPPNSGGAFG